MVPSHYPFYDLGNDASASSPNACIVRTIRSTFSKKEFAVSRAKRTVSVLKVLGHRVRKCAIRVR